MSGRRGLSARGGGRGVRWTAAQWQAHTQGAAATRVHPAATTLALAGAARGPLRGRLRRAIDSVQQAEISGEFRPGVVLRLEFAGALTLSPNELYALTHYRRIGYRKAWHECVYWAVRRLAGSLLRPTPFEHFVLVGHRTSAQLCDPDALSGYFKYAIDGLRYAGVIVDDKAHNMRDLRTTQSIGRPGLSLLVTPWTDSAG